MNSFSLPSLRWRLFAVLLIVVLVGLATVLGFYMEVTLGGLTIYITAYGLIVITRKVLQLWYATQNDRRVRKQVRQSYIDAAIRLYPYLKEQFLNIDIVRLQYGDFKSKVINLVGENNWPRIVANSFTTAPAVALVSPTYKTSDEESVRLVQSVAQQTYPGDIYLEVVLNEENGPKYDFIKTLFSRFARRFLFTRVREEPTPGKRHAMELGFQASINRESVEIVFNVDSDTALHPDAIANAVKTFQADPRIHCLTGDVRVSNPRVNLLTVLTYIRYFFAFNVERSAQSNFYAMTCLSGPFLALRKQTLADILDAWANQTFLGKTANFGDDRHLTTLVLNLGLGANYCPDSIVWTDVPTDPKVWRVQQTRWARSAWRETIIMTPWLHKLHFWTIFDVAYQALFPFILFGILASIILRAIFLALEFGILAGLASFVPYLVVVLLLTFLFQTLYGYLVKKDWRYSLSFLYIYLQYTQLQWIKLWALVTLDVTRWGTK